MTAPATSAPTGVHFVTYLAVAQALADLLRRVSQHSTLCHHYLARDTDDRGTFDLQVDLKQALLTLNGDLDRIAQRMLDAGLIDTEGNALLPPGYTVVEEVPPEFTRIRDGAP